MPATDFLLIGLMGYWSGRRSGASIKGWLAGLHAWHELNGAPWPHNSRHLKFACTASHIAGSHLQHPIQNPITLQHMTSLLLNLDVSSSFHCTVWVVAC